LGGKGYYQGFKPIISERLLRNTWLQQWGLKKEVIGQDTSLFGIYFILGSFWQKKGWVWDKIKRKGYLNTKLEEIGLFLTIIFTEG